MNQVLTPTTEAAGSCAHRWLIEPPAGPTSRARCSRCDAKREFFNDPDQARRDKAAAVEEPLALD